MREPITGKYWGFSLIQPSFVKFVQLDLTQFDKTSHAWQYMELVIVEAQVAHKAQ